MGNSLVFSNPLFSLSVSGTETLTLTAVIGRLVAIYLIRRRP